MLGQNKNVSYSIYTIEMSKKGLLVSVATIVVIVLILYFGVGSSDTKENH